MLVIRLTRTGRKNHATYRIVAAEKARAVQGKYVANLGHYNSHTKELELDREQIQKYLANGAQPSSAVVKLFKSAKLELPAWAEANLKTRQRPPKSEAAQDEAPAEGAEGKDASAEEKTADAEASDANEAPAEEKAAEDAESKDASAEEKAAEASDDNKDVASEKATQESDASTKDTSKEEASEKTES